MIEFSTRDEVGLAAQFLGLLTMGLGGYSFGEGVARYGLGLFALGAIVVLTAPREDRHE